MLIIRIHELLSGRHKILLMGVLCLLGVHCAVAQQEDPEARRANKSRVYLIHSDILRFDEAANPDAQIVEGSVVFRHDSVYMYCDSAYFFKKTNSLEAFGNVHMNQGDTLFLYGDYLFYDGNTQIAMVRENVRMENRNTTLYTDSLNYDRIYNLGYYFDGGMLTDEENVLTSDWGEYSPATKLAVFNHDVKLDNPKMILTSDTLKYHTETKVATILGPSDIVSDNNHIYSELGYYNTATEQAELLNRSVLTSGDGKKLVGDSLFYDRLKGLGEAFFDVTMHDSINKTMLTGNYCRYNELAGSALATQRAVAIDYSQGDSLFLHADTLKMNTYFQDTDSMYRLMRAYYKVRMYRSDLQGVCDSLRYSTQDSCLIMYRDPIVWHGVQQLLGEEILVYMNDSTIDWAHINNQAFTIEQKDSIHYNQVNGKEIKAYFREGQMHKVDVIGNVRLIFYPEDEKDSTMIGMNYSETSLLNMYLVNQKMERLVMSPKTNGTLYPMDQIPPDKLRLSSFAWFDYIRPRNKNDIFNWRGKGVGQELKPTTRKEPPLPNRDLFKK